MVEEQTILRGFDNFFTEAYSADREMISCQNILDKEVYFMPILEVKMWPGRTEEQKSALAKELTRVMVDVGKTEPEATTIIFQEISQSNWAKGGKLFSAAD